MKALTLKEIRLLAPAFAVALVLAVVPVWCLPNNSSNPAAAVTLLPLGFGLVLLAVSAFGREFGLKTFPLLLAQPLPRGAIWRAKVLVLAGVMAVAATGWYSSCRANAWFWSKDGVAWSFWVDFDWISFSWNLSTWFGLDAGFGQTRWADTVALALTGGVVVFAGGLWTALLVRQFVAAFWLTVLVPIGLLVLVGMLGGATGTACGVMAAYTLAGVWYARRQFFQAQEVAWTGGTVALPAWRAAGKGATAGRRAYRPLAASCRKELQMHQLTLAGMAGLFVLHLGVLLLRRLGADTLSYTVRTALEVFGGVWLVVPLLAGSPAVAEERKLGTFESQLCLPLSSRRQVALKLAFVLVLGGLLSALLLWVAEGLGTLIGAPAGIAWFKPAFAYPTLEHLALMGMSVALISFYASTLVRGVLPALAAATGFGLALWLGFAVGAHPRDFFDAWLWQGPLVLGIAWPTLLVTVLWLTHRNYRSLAEGKAVWQRNLGALAGAFLFIVLATTGLYHRAWEYLLPQEPGHGPARFTSTQLARCQPSAANDLTFILPDGRLWADQLTFNPGISILGVHVAGHWVSLGGPQLVTGSNWVDGATSYHETVAVRADGTLWVSERPRLGWNGIGTQPSPLVQFGGDTDWRNVVPEHYPTSVVLRKADGSLWRWGTLTPRRGQAWPGLRAFQPARLRREDGWVKVLRGGSGLYLWKENGEAWVFQLLEAGPPGQGQLEPKLERRPVFDHQNWRSIQASYSCEIGLREDGTLWGWGPGRWDELTRIGAGSNWVALAVGYTALAAIKDDGSLWGWANNSRGDMIAELLAAEPTRLGQHRDWIGVSGFLGSICTLSADGTLWYWGPQTVPQYEGQPQSWDQPLLAPSRRPCRMTRLF